MDPKTTQVFWVNHKTKTISLKAPISCDCERDGVKIEGRRQPKEQLLQSTDEKMVQIYHAKVSTETTRTASQPPPDDGYGSPPDFLDCNVIVNRQIEGLQVQGEDDE